MERKYGSLFVAYDMDNFSCSGLVWVASSGWLSSSSKWLWPLAFKANAGTNKMCGVQYFLSSSLGFVARGLERRLFDSTSRGTVTTSGMFTTLESGHVAP